MAELLTHKRKTHARPLSTAARNDLRTWSAAGVADALIASRMNAAGYLLPSKAHESGGGWVVVAVPVESGRPGAWCADGVRTAIDELIS